jgi:AcrR family transcriptional regulator
MPSLADEDPAAAGAAGAAGAAEAAGAVVRGPDRRSRRREQTRSEILDQALRIMIEDGVAGLTMSRLARAMGVQPPSLYKYYPSLLAVYDALFGRGQRANLEALRDGLHGASPGLDAVAGAMEATGRWAVANPVLAQLLFWRPVPGYEPSAEAFAPALEIIALLRGALAEAVALGQVQPAAASDAGMELLSILHFGVISQHLANDTGSDWEHGRFTRRHADIVRLFVSAYPPPA